MYMVNFNCSISTVVHETPDNTDDTRKNSIFESFKKQLSNSGINNQIKNLLSECDPKWKNNKDYLVEVILPKILQKKYKYDVWNDWREYLLTRYFEEISATG